MAKSPLGDDAAASARRRATNPAYAAAAADLEQSIAIADLVILHRARKGLSQKELAERMGTSITAISRLESGRHMPSTETLRRVATALGGHLSVTIKYAKDVDPKPRARTSTSKRALGG